MNGWLAGWIDDEWFWINIRVSFQMISNKFQCIRKLFWFQADFNDVKQILIFLKQASCSDVSSKVSTPYEVVRQPNLSLVSRNLLQMESPVPTQKSWLFVLLIPQHHLCAKLMLYFIYLPLFRNKARAPSNSQSLLTIAHRIMLRFGKIPHACKNFQ